VLFVLSPLAVNALGRAGVRLAHQHGQLIRSNVVRPRSVSTICRLTAEAPAVTKPSLWVPTPEPELPKLLDEEIQQLLSGLRVQRQELIDGVGNGFAVQDILVDADHVWQCMRNFDGYPDLIGTVKRSTPYEPELEVHDTMCYNILVSRIRLQLNVRFHTDDEQKYIYWTLERPSWVLADSSGFWYVQELEERPGYVRVWFFAAVLLKARVPGFVINLVSNLGLRKACSWWEDLQHLPAVSDGR